MPGHDRWSRNERQKDLQHVHGDFEIDDALPAGLGG
jgi:hypothetical protein